MDLASYRALFFRPVFLLSVGWLIGSAFAGGTLDAPDYPLALSTHISTRGQTASGSTLITLNHDLPCTLVFSVAQAGDEILHNGSAILVTAYKFTGAGLQNGDADWVDSSSFLGHVYDLPGFGPVDQMTLSARGTAPSNTAPEAGTYTASLILTVSW